MTTARNNSGKAYLERFEEMEGELTKLIKDFERAVNIEGLRRTKEAGKWLLSRYFMLTDMI